jgi:hypothetical protein
VRYVTYVKPEPVAIWIVSAYELTALSTGRVPTVTSLVGRLPRPVRAGLVVGLAVWLSSHFQVFHR